MSTSIALWRPLYEALRDNGLLENETKCRRVVIDAEVGKPVVITYEYYAEEGQVYDIARNIELYVGDEKPEVVGRTSWSEDAA